MKLLLDLGGWAASPKGVTRANFVAVALGDLSICLCRGNYYVYCASGSMFACLGGRRFWVELVGPTDEPVKGWKS
jgi:hypothetical protein